MVKMLFDQVKIEEIKDKSVVITSDSVGKDTALGKVLAVGLGHSFGLPQFEKTKVKVGEIVRFLLPRSKIKEDDKEFYVVRERDILYVK